MNILPIEFKKGGMDFKQVARDGHVAIYRQTKPGWSQEYFEVGKIKQHEAYIIAGHEIPATECWPSSEEWGCTAWTYADLTSAKRKMDELCEAEDKTRPSAE